MKSARILVVDSEKSSRPTLQEYLTRIGCDVETAGNGEEALKMFRPGLFDCVISDLSLPVINGLELLRRIRLQDSDVIFLVMTDDPKIDGAVNAVKEGAYDYITKPFHREDVRLKIERALRVSKTEKSLKKAKMGLLTLIILIPVLISAGIIFGIYWNGLK